MFTLILLLLAGLLGTKLVLWAAPLTGVTGSLTCTATWAVSQTISGGSAALASLTPSGAIQGQANFTGVGTTTANKINQVASKVYSVAGGGTSTINLSAAIRNVVNDSAATFARLKAVMIRLLSTAQDATNGTACSSVTVGKAGANPWITQSGSGGFLDGSSGIVIPNGGLCVPLCVDNANGVAIDGTHKDLLITNNDGAVAATVEITFFGADA